MRRRTATVPAVSTAPDRIIARTAWPSDIEHTKYNCAHSPPTGYPQRYALICTKGGDTLSTLRRYLGGGAAQPEQNRRGEDQCLRPPPVRNVFPVHRRRPVTRRSS